MLWEIKRAREAMWSGLCWTLALWYLSGAFWKAFIAGLFACGAVALGLGYRRITQGAVLLPILALLVLFGFPAPQEWPHLIEHALAYLNTTHG